MANLKALLGAGLVAIIGVAQAHSDGDADTPAPEPVVLAPGYEPLKFSAPEPGTYALPPMQAAPDGSVLASDGSRTTLHTMFSDKLVLLSFIYTTCSDVNGCPLATAVLQQVKSKLAREPELKDAVRLVSLSFDPAHDTPEVMASYGAALARDFDWRFLTAASEAELNSTLEGYNQTIVKEYNDQGEFVGTISHILRVFLIDRGKQVRNIYSAPFLHADTLVNDIKTLLAEGEIQLVADASGIDGQPRRHGAGDYKHGYEGADYRTQSVMLARRAGVRADLLKLIEQPPRGLPPVPIPDGAPITRDKIELGRKLFFDRRLSLNDTFSCAMCHIPEQGFASNELSTAVGIEGRTVRRNTPSIYNVAYFKRLFHDGRENRLEQQVWAPLLAKNEMGNPSVGMVIQKIERMSDYSGLFEAAYDGKGPSMETIGEALASYERTLVSGNAPFDRWNYGGQGDALSEGAKRGFKLFTGKAGCVACHTIESDHALFTDNRLHNTGVGFRESMRKEPKTRKIQVAPGVVLDVDPKVYAASAEKRPNDLGLYEITQNPNDRWKYRTPTLRNVALTAPYMHNGSLVSLRDVVAFYNEGGVPNEVLDPLVRPLGLSEPEIDDLVAFLESLTGDNVDELVADAFAAPIGDLRKEDPNWTHANRLDD